jgi:hypothetical protein
MATPSGKSASVEFPLLPDWSDSGQREGTGPVIWGSAEAAKFAGARIDELPA